MTPSKHYKIISKSMTKKQSDQEYAAKLILLYIDKLAHRVIAINRGDYTQKELKKIISDFKGTTML